jgi:tetratricopeptide (TPR) repeat protein
VTKTSVSEEVYLVLELVAREPGYPDASLRAWMGQPLPPATALLFALQIARGMQHATEMLPGFVHRDLKPENVLVGADKLPGTAINRLRVTDFGLAAVLESANLPTAEATHQPASETARSTHRSLLTEGGILGTPEYMAPEQWESHSIDARADLYAVGCILLEMLLGKMPVKAKPRLACRELHQSGQAAQKARSLHMPEEIKSLLSRCLAVNPEARFENWRDLEAALAAVYSGVTEQVAPKALPVATLGPAARVQAGWSYNAMGLAYKDLGKAAVAAGYFERAAQVAAEEGDPALRGTALGNLGLAYAQLGEVRRAIGYSEQALAIHREIGDRHEEGSILGNLGLAYADLGEVRRAISYYEQHLEIAREIGDRRGEGNALGNLGLAYADLGEVRRAIGYFEQHLEIAREIGDRRGEGQALGNLGTAYVQLGEVRRAIDYFEQDLEIAREIGNRRGEGQALGNLGNAYADLGEVRRAIGYYEQCLIIHREIGDRRGEGADLGNLGTAYAQLGEVRRAIGYFEQALAIRKEIGDIAGVATDSFNMALLHAQQGRAAQALPLAQQAAQIFAQIGSPNAQVAQQLVAQLQGGGRAPAPNAAQQAFEAFQRADSPAAMQAAVAQFPLLVEPDFIAAVAQAIAEQVPPEHRPAFEQRLAWLREIAQDPGA